MLNNLIKSTTNGIRYLDKKLMVNTYYLSVFGKDRIGIVNDISNNIKKLDGSIDNSLMSALGNHFTVTLKASFPKHTNKNYLQAILKENLKPHKLDVYFFDDMNNGVYNKNIDRKTYKIYGSLHDQQGIVSDLSKLFENSDSYIKKLESNNISAPFAGYPLFEFKAIIEIPDDSYDMIETELDNLEQKYSGTISIDDMKKKNDSKKEIVNVKQEQQNLVGV